MSLGPGRHRPSLFIFMQIESSLIGSAGNPSLPPSSRPPCEISPGSLQPILLNTIIFRQSTRNILKYYILILTTGTLGYNNVNYVFKYLCCYKHGPVTRSCFIVLTSEFEYFPIENLNNLHHWSRQHSIAAVTKEY